MENIKTNIILIAFLTIVSLTSFSTDMNFKLCDEIEPVSDTLMDEQFLQAYTLFAKAILSQDINLIKSLSSECIQCTDCVMNTAVEDSLFEKFQESNPNLWYDKLYNEYSYIPIDRFIKEDLEIIFNEKVKSRLLDNSKFICIDNTHNAKVYAKVCIIGTTALNKSEFKEVLLTYIDPTPKFEGSQWAFAFIKTNGIYKFCGFSTIP